MLNAGSLQTGCDLTMEHAPHPLKGAGSTVDKILTTRRGWLFTIICHIAFRSRQTVAVLWYGATLFRQTAPLEHPWMELFAWHAGRVAESALPRRVHKVEDTAKHARITKFVFFARLCIKNHLQRQTEAAVPRIV